MAYMKKTTFHFLIILIAMCLASCQTIVKHSDPFFKDDGGFDAAYIPLIKPYRVVKLLGGEAGRNEHKWVIDLIVPPDKKDLYYYLQIYDVTKIAVVDKVIIAYSPDSITLTDGDKRVGQEILYWFVIIPDQKIETGFETEEEFLAYIHILGIEKLSWIEPSVARQQLLKTGCLDWIPSCK